MAKDPAFLFYTKDFMAGTQDMSCDEVGAYLRLLMYQHQHDSVPDDKERMMRICGIFSESKFDQIWLVVKPKFNQTDNHLVNERLNHEINKRSEYKPKKIASATLAGLISSNKTLTQEQRIEVKKAFKINDFVTFEETEIKEKIKEWFMKMVNQMVNYLANANANVNTSLEDIGGTGEKETFLTNPPAEPEPVGSEAVQAAAREAWEDKIWREAILMGNSLKPDDLAKWMAKYNASLANDVIKDFSTRSYKKMFGGWLSTQIAKGYKLASTEQSQAYTERTKTYAVR